MAPKTKQTLMCELCGPLKSEEYKERRDLNRHVASHKRKFEATAAAELRFKCEICSRGFEFPNGLQDHILEAHRSLLGRSSGGGATEKKK